MALATGSVRDKQLGDETMPPLRLFDKDVARLVQHQRPAYRLAGRFGDEDRAPFGGPRFHCGPMLGGERRIEAAIGLEGIFEFLKAPDEGEDCRLVVRQSRQANRHVTSHFPAARLSSQGSPLEMIPGSLWSALR